MKRDNQYSQECVRAYFKRRKEGFVNEVEIAPWKLDSKFENWLSYLADRWELCKKL